MKRDSSYSYDEAVRAKPETACPQEILESQVLLDVFYFNFEGEECSGQIVVHKDVSQDVKDVFSLIHELRFPVAKVMPVVNYAWDDEVSCEDNNASGFNYRTIAGTDRLSNHALGKAIDINPVQNPYTRWKEGVVVYHSPRGAVYNKDVPGTLCEGHPVVEFLQSKGWTWGGEWLTNGNVVDYQHFEKL